MSKKGKLALLYIFSFIISIAPITIIIACNWSHYTKTPASTVSLSVGGIMAVGLIIVKTLGKMPQNVNRLVKYGILFGIVWLLEPIILDLKVLLGAAFLGELLDSLFFVRKIRQLKEEIYINKTAQATADITTKAVEEAIEKTLGGRV